MLSNSRLEDSQGRLKVFKEKRALTAVVGRTLASEVC